jgi:hypothetical protein
LDDHWITWCLTNRIVSRVEVDLLAGSWLAGGEPGDLPESRLTTSSADIFVAGKRLQLATRRLSGPAEFDAAQEEESAGDLALVERDYRAARSLLEHPEDVTAWSGLALASVRLDGPRIWRERPELVRGVYRRLGETLAEPPAPGVIAEWLASGR